MTDLRASLHEMLLSVESIQNQLNALRTDAMDVLRMLNATDQTAPKRLEVEWLSQLGPTAAYAPGDCGAACLAMLINYRGAAHPTVDEVSRITRKPQGYTLLSFSDLITAAAYYKVMLEHSSETLDRMCVDIDDGKPTIALVNYRSLPAQTRYDPKYNSGHYLLIVGYDADCLIYHDPYWPVTDAASGAFKRLTRDEFMRAYTAIAPGNTRAPHALRIV